MHITRYCKIYAEYPGYILFIFIKKTPIKTNKGDGEGEEEE